MINISMYSLRLVKEKSGRYDFNSRRMSDPASAAEVAREVMEMDRLAEEIFCILALDTKNNLVGMFQVSHGNLNSSIVHPREVFKRALLVNANSIILIHNHPSGDPRPSNEDLNITKRLMDAGELLGIKVLDHIILGEEGYISLKEHNWI